MNNEKDHLPNDPQVSALLRQARLSPALPPRFPENVWRRIGDAQAPATPASWLDLLAGLIFRPRFALAAAAVMLLAGVLAGTVQGRQAARQEARMNYLASVAPQSLR
jgi:hypothetical protein